MTMTLEELKHSLTNVLAFKREAVRVLSVGTNPRQLEFVRGEVYQLECFLDDLDHLDEDDGK